METPAGIEGLTSYRHIASKCIEFVPGWTDLREEEISIRPMLEGLSNLLFRVERPPSFNSGQQIMEQVAMAMTVFDIPRSSSSQLDEVPSKVLFRVYGLSVTSFYDADLELAVFRTMSHFQYGPRMFAHGTGWRIEEYYDRHTVVKVQELPNPRIYLQVARKLGALHQVWRSRDFPTYIKKRPPICMARLDTWTSEALKALRPLPNQRAPAYEIPEGIMTGIDEMKGALVGGVEAGTLGFHLVFSHGDVQENNMMVGLDDEDMGDLRLIDFEYADMNLQGADIGNFFGEFTMDYTVSEFPMFAGDNSKYPSLDVQEEFISAYLEVYLGCIPRKSQVCELRNTIHTFRQLNNILWGMWSVIRSKQNADTKFGLFEYAKFRFDTFLRGAQYE